jgi:hypothetical protein
MDPNPIRQVSRLEPVIQATMRVDLLTPAERVVARREREEARARRERRETPRPAAQDGLPHADYRA